MNLLVLAAVSIAGGAGAALRYLIDKLTLVKLGQRISWSTVVVNLSGSLLAGMLLAIAPLQLPQPWEIILITGFLGGYTTFSTASLETVQLLLEGKGLSALLHSIGMLLGCVGCALIGLYLFS